MHEQNEPTLAFIPNTAGEGEGMRDAGIETFRDNPFSAVARETGQNSRDAAANDNTVRVRFERIVIEANQLPSIVEYRDAAERCLSAARSTGDEAEIAFFENATAVLEQDELSVFRISDYNTKGLVGPCEAGTPFHTLVKSSGVSSKDDNTAGGSFGIGKNAVYATSDLQTVFYSTLYEDEGEQRFLCQGKTLFRSFSRGEEQLRATGYWGNAEGFRPVSDPSAVPEWLHRGQQGTTLCAIAMRDVEDWRSRVVASLIQNFFHAIHSGNMEFEVGDERISGDRLTVLFGDRAVQEAASQNQAEEDFQFATHMLECLRSEEAYERTLDVQDAGTFQLRFLVADHLPKRIGFVRNGMYITDNMKAFGDGLRRFVLHRNFAAIVEPVTKEASAWLRSLENPRHDDLSPDRLPDKRARRQARNAGRNLIKQVRAAIEEIAKPEAKAETDLDELSEFFSREEDRREDDKGEQSTSRKKIKKLAPARAGTSMSVANDDGANGDTGGGSQGDDTNNPSGTGGGAGTGSGAGGTGRKGGSPGIPLSHPRTLLPDPSDTRRRRVWFTPSSGGRAVLRFAGSGISGSDEIGVVGGPIVVDLKGGERSAVDVTFDRAYDGPVEIIARLAKEPGE